MILHNLFYNVSLWSDPKVLSLWLIHHSKLIFAHPHLLFTLRAGCEVILWISMHWGFLHYLAHHNGARDDEKIIWTTTSASTSDASTVNYFTQHIVWFLHLTLGGHFCIPFVIVFFQKSTPPVYHCIPKTLVYDHDLWTVKKLNKKADIVFFTLSVC